MKYIMAKRHDKKIKLPPKKVIILAAIVLLALTLRFICFSQLKANYPPLSNPFEGTDMLTTHRDAIAHLEGTYNTFPHYLNALYPYFVSLIYLIFGQNILIAKIVQIFLGALNCILVYFISKEVFNRNIGLIAAFLAATYMMFIIYNSILLTVTLLNFLILTSLLILLKIKKQPSYLLTIGAGISMGLAALARGSSVLFIPPIMLWLAVTLKAKGKKAFSLPLVFLISSLAVISIITIQNFCLGGKFVPITTNAGVNFAIGNCPGAQGWVHYPKWLTQRQDKGYDNSSFWVKETLKTIWKQPLEWSRLMLKKFCLFWHYREMPNNINQEAVKAHSPLLKHLPLFTFGAVVPLALIGIALSFKEWKKLSLLYIFLFTYMCAVIIAVIASRYRLPFVQLLIPFAAFAIYQVYMKLKERNFKYTGFIILLLIPGLVLTRAYDIYQQVEKGLYIKSHPHGIYSLSDNILTIRDDSRRWQGETAILGAYEQKLKKNLTVNIDKEISEIKKAYLELFLACPRKEGEIILEINNRHLQRIECTQIYTGNKITSINISFDPSLLIQGENSFIFSVAEGGILIIPIDNYYNYKRSAFSSNLGLEWDYADLSPDRKGKNKGEYVISLRLEL